ncbi:MAG: phage tail tape measure protein [Kofleriaceae bacterium]
MNVRKARALIAIGADSSKLGGDLNAAKRKLRGFGGDSKKLLGKGLGAIGSGGKMLLGGGLLGAGFAAGGALGDFAGDMLAFEKGLTRFQIASGKTANQVNLLREEINRVSRETGVGRDQILAGAQTYVDLTGDVKGAETAMRSFSKISVASGASMGDIATAAAALQQSLGLESGDITAAFSGLIAQGKAGAVSLKDLAGELSSVAPRFAKFGLTGVEGVASLGAALQVARQGFGSASEAATGLEALMGALAQNSAKFQAAGVKIFNVGKDGRKTFRGFAAIVDSIGRSRLAKDPTLLAKAMGSKEASQTFDMLTKNRALLDDLVTAGQDRNAVERDYLTFQTSAAGKIEKAFNAAKISLAEAFTPERIEKFANALVKILGLVSDIVEGISEVFAPIDMDSLRANALAVKDSQGNDVSTRKQQLARAVDLAGASDARLESGGFTREQRDQAVSRLFTEALDFSEEIRRGMALQESIRAGQGREGAALVAGITRQLTEALAKANIQVNLDGSNVAKKVDQAPVHRQGRR